MLGNARKNRKKDDTPMQETNDFQNNAQLILQDNVLKSINWILLLCPSNYYKKNILTCVKTCFKAKTKKKFKYKTIIKIKKNCSMYGIRTRKEDIPSNYSSCICECNQMSQRFLYKIQDDFLSGNGAKQSV